MIIFEQCKGLADSLWSGIKGSVSTMVGLDANTTPGLLQVRQKLTKSSGATIDSFPKWAISASDGSQLWFSSTSGKIWLKTSADVWSLVYTTTPAAGAAGCLGCIEHDGYIYWATQSRLHRKTTTDISDWTGSGGITEDWGTFTNANASFHPIFKRGIKVFIGDGNLVASITGIEGAHAFTASALDIRKPHIVKCLGEIDIDLLIGTYVNDNVNDVTVYRWDTVSTSWSTLDTVPENGINAFIKDDNDLFVQAGQFGKIYFYDGQKLVPFKRIPGTWSPTSYGEINQGSVASLLSVPVFGFSNGSGNPCLEGIYSFGSYSRNYNKIMDLSWIISPKQTTNVSIGAILVSGADMYVAFTYSNVVTMTIAAPCVVTLTGHNQPNGTAIMFTTTGALPTGLTASTYYYIRSATDDTFNLYDTAAHAIAGGATGRVTTTGSQSGVHTAANYGVDKLDYTAKYDGAYLETMMLDFGEARNVLKTILKAGCSYATLPTSTAITFSIKKYNGDSWDDLTSVTDSKLRQVVAETTVPEVANAQIKVAFTISANTAPTIENLFANNNLKARK